MWAQKKERQSQPPAAGKDSGCVACWRHQRLPGIGGSGSPPVPVVEIRGTEFPALKWWLWLGPAGLEVGEQLGEQLRSLFLQGGG